MVSDWLARRAALSPERLALVRAWYLDNATGEVLSTDAAVVIARTLLAPLRLAMRAVLVLGLVIALAGFLAGTSAPARWLGGQFDFALKPAVAHADAIEDFGDCRNSIEFAEIKAVRDLLVFPVFRINENDGNGGQAQTGDRNDYKKALKKSRHGCEGAVIRGYRPEVTGGSSRLA